MYKDRSLVPTQAVRLAALGFLADGSRSYGALAGEVRQFISRTASPSIELLGPSIELLRLEGLVQSADGAPTEANPFLTITAAGREVLRDLMCAPVRATEGDLNRLVVGLKLRFLDHLAAADRALVVAGLVDAAERELDRMTDLRATVADAGHLAGWSDLDIQHLERRIDWLRQLG
ncbi:putative AphA-like transcriptional regulator [Stella humosa]|uniref:Putative AphA-like transcriptional regulator n=1 Tax=Stella humosa TaxID=94 RepID=A0A3N1MA62_9PROT|nr:hypothetical protein [Stella humosa]ROQ00518.1 putative AphA-like transcriptional regulator [Stella humosa]BBK30238.1 hypothetical protein STHU_08720 [Stella humosa]